MAKKSFRELLYFDNIKVVDTKTDNVDTNKYLNSVEVSSDATVKTFNVSRPDVPELDKDKVTMFHVSRPDVIDNELGRNPETNQDYSKLEIYHLDDKSDTTIKPNKVKTGSLVTNNYSDRDPDYDKNEYSKSMSPNGVGGSLTTSKNYKEAVKYEGDAWFKVGNSLLAAGRLSSFAAKVADRYGNEDLAKFFNDSSTMMRYLNSMTRNHIEPIVKNPKDELLNRTRNVIKGAVNSLFEDEEKVQEMRNILYTDDKTVTFDKNEYDSLTGRITVSTYKKVGAALKSYFKSLIPKNPFSKSSSGGEGLPEEIRSTKKAITSKTINTLFDYKDDELGRLFYTFKDNLKEEARMKYLSSNASYYKTITSPYLATQQVNSPYDAFQYACNNLGFSRGYHDYGGFSIGNDGLWGMTIEPYVSPFGIISLAPPLPKVSVPMWINTITTNNDKPQLIYKDFDFGKTPPVMSYQINWATLRSKQIDLANGGSFSIPLGLQHQMTLTLNMVDDEHHSIRNYMAYYFNTVYKPAEGLLAPYDMASFLITITSFKPGLKVNFMFKLICVPMDYTMSYEGSESMSNGSTVTITFSIVGMKSPNDDTVVDPTVNYWRHINWTDVTITPCNYGGMIGNGTNGELITNTSLGGEHIVINEDGTSQIVNG